MASSLLFIAKSIKASKGSSLTICALPLSSETSPILASCSCALIVLDDTDTTIRSVSNKFEIIPCKCR